MTLQNLQMAFGLFTLLLLVIIWVLKKLWIVLCIKYAFRRLLIVKDVQRMLVKFSTQERAQNIVKPSVNHSKLCWKFYDSTEHQLSWNNIKSPDWWLVIWRKLKVRKLKENRPLPRLKNKIRPMPNALWKNAIKIFSVRFKVSSYCLAEMNSITRSIELTD